VRQQAQI